MTDNHLCIMAILVVVAYGIYMTFGPGGDGIIFGTVIGAICALGGIHYGRRYASGTVIEVTNEDRES